MSQPVYFWPKGAYGTRKWQKHRKGAPEEQGQLTQVRPHVGASMNRLHWSSHIHLCLSIMLYFALEYIILYSYFYSNLHFPTGLVNLIKDFCKNNP